MKQFRQNASYKDIMKQTAEDGAEGETENTEERAESGKETCRNSGKRVTR